MTNSDADYDLVVAGGGPAGLAVAQTAASGGLRVILIHKDREFGRPVRTSGGSWTSHLRQLEIPETLYQRIDRLSFDIDTHPVEYSGFADPPVVLNVTGVYQYLAEMARSASATLVPGCRVTAVERTDQTFAVRLSGVSEMPSTIRCRAVVDATGTPRFVLSALKLRPSPKRFGVGAEIEFRRDSAYNPHLAHLAVGRESLLGGYGWVFPTSYDTLRVGVGLLRPDSRRAPQACLESYLAEVFPGVTQFNDIERHSGYIASDGLKKIFVAPSVYAAGDASSHAVSTVGEGIRYCIDVGRRLGAAIARGMSKGNADIEVQNLDREWSGLYQDNFSKAQVLNVAMGGFSKSDWKALLPILRALSADEVGHLLRAEKGKRIAMSALRSAPLSSVSVGIRLLRVMLASKLHSGDSRLGDEDAGSGS